MEAITEKVVAENISSFSWKIDNWTWVMENEDLITKEKFYFDTEGRNNIFQSKWEVGFIKPPTAPKLIQYYWSLKEYDAIDKFPVLISFQIIQAGRNIGTTRKALKYATANSTNTVNKGIPLDQMWWLKNWLSRFDPITIEMRMEILPVNELPTRVTAELLNDRASSDLSIYTSDGIELHGHQVIFNEKCPAFLEIHSLSADDKIYLKTVTEKTMRIFLRFIYIDELEKTWQDEENIVEFTKAAGRYKMTELINMLDNILGEDQSQTAKYCHVLLLPLAEKYCLKKAESMLLSRIVRTVNNAKISDDLFNLFGYERPKDLKSTTTPKILKVIEVWNELRKLKEASFRDVILLGLVEKLHLREMENQLLKRIRTTVNNVKNGQQLLELFGKDEKFEAGAVAILKEAYEL